MKLAFRKYGESGPALIIVHGLYGASDNWITIARGLSDRFEVFLPDQRNHGESPHGPEHTYAAMQEDLREFMDDQGIEKAILMGHSMGGKTVMFFSHAYPERIQSLVVVDIAPSAYHDLALESHGAANHAKMMDAMLELDLGKYETREEVSAALAPKIGSERIRMFLLKNLTRSDDGSTFIWKINLPVLRENLDRILDGLPVDDIRRQGGIKGFPVLFINGAKSDYINADQFPVIQAVYPAAEIVTIKDAGHWVHAEQPDLLIRNLLYWLG